MTRNVTAWADDFRDQCRGVSLRQDEAANIAPIPSLPNLLADGGGSGITTVCVLQSLAQARARWGPAGADAM
jgi:type IV secretion system protein VirD4